MVKVFVAVFVVLFISFNSFAVTIHDLFESLKKQPVTKVDIMVKKYFEAEYSKAKSGFYPKIYSIASYEHFNSPTNLRPLTPTESNDIAKTGGGFPFSKDIEQLGLKISMPVFVYPLFSLTSMAKKLMKSAEARQRLNLIKNEAVIVSLNAKLRYLDELIKSTTNTKNSLIEELRIVNVAVKNGRLPEVASIKIRNKIDQMDIAINDLKTARSDVISTMASLTGITLKAPPRMKLVKDIEERELFATKPLEYKLRAKRYQVKATEGELYPSIYLGGTILRKFGESYNNDEDIVRNYGWIGLYLQLPIFDKVIYSNIEKAKSDYIKTHFQLDQLIQDLRNEAKSLNANLKIIKRSMILAEKNVEYQKELLIYAKKAFELRRMTEEEYLRYEDALLEAEANLYGLKAKKWAILSRLAVIFGNNLEELVR